MSAPIRVRCEGSGWPPATEVRPSYGEFFGICKMCGEWFPTVVNVPEHDRDDVLAMLDRGDFDEAKP